MTPLKCTHCGQPVNVPNGTDGGAVVCTNPACGKTFSSEASGPLERVAGTMRRPSGNRPALLDRIPRSFIASPTMFPIGVAVALLYGLVLFGIVNARKNQPEPEPEPSSIAVAPVNVMEEPVGGAPTQTAASKPVAATEENPDIAGQAARPVMDAAPTVAAAVVSNDVPVTTPTEPVVPNLPTWGKLEGTVFDCQPRLDRNGLILLIPGTLHVNSTELALKNAPRFLMPAQGDFNIVVSVRGQISPGTEPLPDLPFTFQGAGLLIWSDENNYLRLERTSTFSADRRKFHQILLETCRDGKTSKPQTREVREADLVLRIDRKGSDFRCQYSFDGKAWIEFKRQTLSLPDAVGVGISASNASPKSFPARFDDFEMIDPSAKGAKGS